MYTATRINVFEAGAKQANLKTLMFIALPPALQSLAYNSAFGRGVIYLSYNGKECFHWLQGVTSVSRERKLLEVFVNDGNRRVLHTSRRGDVPAVEL